MRCIEHARDDSAVYITVAFRRWWWPWREVKREYFSPYTDRIDRLWWRLDRRHEFVDLTFGSTLRDLFMAAEQLEKQRTSRLTASASAPDSSEPPKPES